MVKLNADTCDVLEQSGLVDPLPVLPPDVRRVVSDSSLLFPDPPGGLAGYQGIKDADRIEYVRLVVKQIKSAKVGLRRAGGTVFGVGKKGTSKVREVWDGSRVSDACVAPPLPPLLPLSFFLLSSRGGKA